MIKDFHHNFLMIGLKKETNRSVYSFNHSKSSVWDDSFVKSHFLYKSTVEFFVRDTVQTVNSCSVFFRKAFCNPYY